MESSVKEEPIGEEWRPRPWLWVAIALGMGVLFVVTLVAHSFGFAHIDLDSPPFQKWSTSFKVLFYVLDAVAGSNTTFALAVIAIWTAVIGRFERDRLALIVGLYLTALLVRAPISAFLGAEAHGFGGALRFPSTTALYATIVYGGLVFVFDRSAIPVGTRRALGTVALLAMFVGWVFPIWAGWAQLPDVMGGIGLTGMLFAIGVAITQFAGVDVLSVSDRDA